MRSFLLKLLSLALVLYVLLFHLVGIMTMPNGDMYPRIDAGDLILFYRLEKNIKDQDIVVIDKAVNMDFSAVGSGEESSEETAPAEGTEETTKDVFTAETTLANQGNAQETENGVDGEDTANQLTPAEETAAEDSRDKAEKPWWRKVLTFLKVPDPDAPETTRFVCRVVAAPGDTVEIADGTRLLVNGNSLIETGIFYPTTEYVGFVDYPVTLGSEEYFVMADYRNGGADSRFFGPVKLEEIQGVVITIMRRNNL